MMSAWWQITKAIGNWAKSNRLETDVKIVAGFSALLVIAALDLQAVARDDNPSTQNLPAGKPLTGGVDTKDEEVLSQTINSLLNSSLNRKSAFCETDVAVSKYRTGKHKAWSKLKDASNFLVPWHGFGPSSEAGDVILDEKVKLKSLESAEYARQVQVEATHIELIDKMLQFAEQMGSGKDIEVDAVRSEVISLTSPADARSLEELIQSLDTSDVTEAIKRYRPPFSARAKRQKGKELADHFIKGDAVVIEIVKRIHKYNHRSSAALASSHVVETTLGLACLMPNVLAPASQGALMTYEMANGGSEENKLIKELYLERRLQSRRQSLTELAQILVDSYEDAMARGNAHLAALAKKLMTEYGDAETTELVINPQVESLNLAERHKPTGGENL